MANKIKKLFIAGSLVSGLFMAITACNFNHANSSSFSYQNSSSETTINSSSNSPISSSSEVISSSSEAPAQSSSSQAPAQSSSSEAPASSSQTPASSSSVAPVIVLESISATPNKNTYEYGEELSVVVTANYSDGANEVVTNYEVTGFNNKVPGEQNVTVTYHGESVSFKVLVNNPVLVDITASSQKESYEYGEELDIVVTANYSDGSSVVVTDYQVQGYNKNNPGEQEVLVTYQGKNASFSVKVNDPILLNITAEGQKDSYEYGEQLDISVSATYSDGSSVAVNEYEITGFDSTKPGEQTVTVTYEGKTYSFITTINNPVLISVIAEGQKESYEYGEELDISVSATYSDNSTKEVTNYTVEGFDSTKPGEQTVTVTYEGKTYSFVVTINNPVLTSITAISNKDSYEYGEELDLVVTANYSDGSSVVITDYQVQDYDVNQSGVQSITIVYEGESCSLDISIKEKADRFPIDKLNSFLQLEGIKTSIPTPVGYNVWYDSVEVEQDGSNYFYATTKDEGKVGGNSIADQYIVLLTRDGWMVDKFEGGYKATKNKGDAEIVFLTANKEFFIHINAYVEFPTHKTTGLAVANINSLNDGDEVIFGSISNEYVITGFEDGYFTTSACKFVNNSPDSIAKNAWRFTLNKVGSNWTLTDIKGRKLGATGLGQLVWDEGSMEWSLMIANKLAIFNNVNSEYGHLSYNSNTRKITTYSNGNGLSYPHLFKLNTTEIIYPTEISISGKNEIGKGRKTTLSVEYTPSNANSLSDITWSSSNEAVASVNQYGVATGISVGQTTITARTKSKDNYLTASFDVTVTQSSLDRWTIMLYICGADLESDDGLATADIKEILNVKNKPEDVNIIMETGGTTSWHYNGIDANALTRFHVSENKLVQDEKLSKANMGKQSTFESFLNWGLEKYPAEKTGVILWNHGGALDGVCYDGNDSLTNSETASAFENVFTSRGINKLEFIGYDACLMQVQDIAEFNSKYFNYMVGSQEAEVGEGWVYDEWLDDLYADADSEVIFKANCDSFVSTYGSDQTLSYLDLSKMANYLDKFEAMAGAIKDTAKNNYSSFKNLIKKVKDFGDVSYYGYVYYNGLDSYGTIDGMDFLTKLGKDSNYSAFEEEINAAKEAFNQVVKYSRRGSDAGNANGLTIIAATSVSYPSSETHFTNWRSIFR